MQPIPEYKNEVENHQKVADREYDGQYRGATYHHEKGEDAKHLEETQHMAHVSYRGAEDDRLVG